MPHPAAMCLLLRSFIVSLPATRPVAASSSILASGSKSYLAVRWEASESNPKKKGPAQRTDKSEEDIPSLAQDDLGGLSSRGYGGGVGRLAPFPR